MAVNVRFFAILRERAGCSETSLRHRAGMSVADAVSDLVAANVLDPAIAASSFMCAVNERYATRNAVLADGDELALIPPVSGG